MSLPFLSDSSLASRIFVDLLEGLMRPLGKLTLVLVADLSLPLHVSVSGGFLGGPNAAIGQVDIGWWPICHSHSMFQYLGDFLEGLMRPLGKLTLVGGRFVTPTPCVVSGGFLGGPNLSDCHSHSTIGSRMCHGLLRPISACHLVFSSIPQTYQPMLGSHQVLHSPQDGLVCFILFLPATLFAHPYPRPISPCLDPIMSSTQDGLVCFILFLPATLFAHPSPRPISPCLDPIKSSTHLKMAWFASSYFCLLPCLLTLSPDLSASAWLPSSPPLTSRWLGLHLLICTHHLIHPPFLHRVLLHGRLAGRLIHRWFGCSSNVSHQ